MTLWCFQNIDLLLWASRYTDSSSGGSLGQDYLFVLQMVAGSIWETYLKTVIILQFPLVELVVQKWHFSASEEQFTPKWKLLFTLMQFQYSTKNYLKYGNVSVTSNLTCYCMWLHHDVDGTHKKQWGLMLLTCSIYILIWEWITTYFTLSII